MPASIDRSRPRSRVVLLGMLIMALLVACSGAPSVPSGSTPPVPTPPGASLPPVQTLPPARTPAAQPSATAPAGQATPTATLDLSGVDACALLDEQAAKALTGVSLDFDNDQFDNLHCFWAIPIPGEPAYAELTIAPRSVPLSEYGYAPGGGTCTRVPLPGLAAEAAGGTCSGEQAKVYLLARHESGVLVTLLVNEPERALSPADLADSVRSVLEGIR